MNVSAVTRASTNTTNFYPGVLINTQNAKKLCVVFSAVFLTRAVLLANFPDNGQK